MPALPRHGISSAIQGTTLGDLSPSYDGNQFCIGGNCFNTTYTSDADFARSVTFMEAAREAGVYLDTDRMQMFKGEDDRCPRSFDQELLRHERRRRRE